jgi:hypothetical protein
MRAAFLDGLLVLVWAFFAYVSLLNPFLGIFRFNILVVCLLVCLGVVFGLFFGAGVALKQIGSIEKNGEFKATRKTWAFLLLAIIVIIILVPNALNFLSSLGLMIQTLSFLYPLPSGVFAGRMILYLNWERKHKSRILSDGLVFLRTYAVPKIEKMPNSTF